ncbi:MAG: LysR substrate-binding domain-containing protein [Polaromonas sp.]|uniref:LysR substrate-binding domain-containing protein n=1 Tax=Polaromonas sp. TaxID=1869339 RepID=UPI0027315206|nr:LysR substrate-binding domain-containing protein [Polaromonas sp.]MDP1741243.1 LysR substrate-binding domain-containing protein [Polaromonas sp.]MDP1955011.1 LysR substrate-binding domain-containing protein [Polaromonas sp.]MDP3753457.1 LysR substrate-binding domain-containing protein [Polaromonas sp.]
MDLKQLEYFVRVAELGSFTRASIALDIAQPALSRQVRLLEVELRQNLLTRTGRGAIPTEAGKLLLKHGRGILHQVEVAREELAAVRGGLAGRVSIGLPPSLSKLITVPLTHAFRQQLPLAQLTLTEGFSVLMQEGLRVGNLDMAVLYNAERSPELEVTTLHAEELVLISHKTGVKPAGIKPAGSKKGAREKRQTIRLAAVAELPLILPSRPNAFRILIEGEMITIGCKPQVTLEVDGLNAILSLVREGMGHAILPSYTLSNVEDPAPFTLRSIHSPRIMSELTLARSSRRASTDTQKMAIEVVTSVVAQALKPYT